MKTIFYSFATLIRKILFSSLEDKIHIFAPPCIDSMQKAVNDVNIFTSEDIMSHGDSLTGAFKLNAKTLDCLLSHAVHTQT